MATIYRTRAAITGVNGLPGLSTFYWRSGTPSNSEATTVLSAVRSYFESAKGLLASGVIVTYDQSVDLLNDVSGELQAQYTSTAQSATVSTGSSEAPPANQLGLTLQTGVVVNGRVLRGRTFLGPVTADVFTAGGIPSGAAKTTLATAGALLTAVTTTFLVVWHRPTNGSGGISLQCTDVTPATKAWVLRSRRD